MSFVIRMNAFALLNLMRSGFALLSALRFPASLSPQNLISTGDCPGDSLSL